MALCRNCNLAHISVPISASSNASTSTTASTNTPLILKENGIMKGVAGKTNNPGNITCNGKFMYDGQIDVYNKRFAVFPTPEHGIRTWFSYIERKRKGGYNTIRKMWYMYAPSNENKTENYIKDLGRMTGMNVDEMLPPVPNNKDLYWTLAKACFKVECSYVPSSDTLQKAWDMFMKDPNKR